MKNGNTGTIPSVRAQVKMSLLTGGQDLHYALGLLSGLVKQDIEVEFIGNDSMQASEYTKYSNVNYINLRGNQSSNAPLNEKVRRVLIYYARLLGYAATTDSKIFHILWLNKFTYLDRTLINLYYKLLGKKLLYTAHDINYRKLVGEDTVLNNLTLKFMYHLVDHIFVHTNVMKKELTKGYNISADKISVVPFGVNEVIPSSNVSSSEARRKLNLGNGEKVILFFGNIAPYKGVEYLIEAMHYLKARMENVKLIVAGRIKQDCQTYWNKISEMIEEYQLRDSIMCRTEYIPEEEAEIYFKSADLLVLPYKHIFQSGLIYTSYRFGLPVVATDVGSLRDDVVEGKTGFVCKAEDPEDLANRIQVYFNSNMYKDLASNRHEIIRFATDKYSWAQAGKLASGVYKKYHSK